MIYIRINLIHTTTFIYATIYINGLIHIFNTHDLFFFLHILLTSLDFSHRSKFTNYLCLTHEKKKSYEHIFLEKTHTYIYYLMENMIAYIDSYMTCIYLLHDKLIPVELPFITFETLNFVFIYECFEEEFKNMNET